MTAAHARSLLLSLETLLKNIAGSEPIGEQLAEIDRLQREIESTAPAQLTHFLQRRSYAKALEYLKAGFVVDDPNRPDCDDDAHP